MSYPVTCVVSSVPASFSEMHCSVLHRKLNEFRYDGRYCDISIRMQNTTVQCHRVVLASISEFFDVMFYSPFRENKEEEIVLHEIDPLAFGCIMEFAYLGQEPNFFKFTNNLFDILKACDYLRVHNLVELCISHIMKHTSSVKNVCKIYAFSCVSNYPTLSDALSSFIAEDFYTVSRYEDFLILSYEQLSTIMDKMMERYESCKSVGPPLFKDTDLLLDAIIRWILYSFQERKIHFLDLVSIVNIEEVSENYLKFLTNEYKVNSDGFIDLKSCLKAFFMSETKDAMPVVVYKHPLKNSTLHVYVEYKNLDVNVFSISKFQSKRQWSSIELKDCRVFEGHSETMSNVEMIALDEPYNYLYCLSLGSASFSSYPTVSLNEKKTLKVPHFKYSEFSTMCGFQNSSIYLYDHQASFAGEPRARKYISVLNYKCELDKWFTVPELKASLVYSELVADDKLVYLIGGGIRNDKMYFPQYVQAYDCRTSKWQELTKLSATKLLCSYQKFCCCCLNGKIYATDAKKMEVFDPVAQKWMVLNYNNCIPENTPVEIHEVLPYENHLWIFYSELASWFPWKLIIFDPNAMTWLPYKSFSDSVDEFLQKKCDSVTFLNTIVFKPLDVNAV